MPDLCPATALTMEPPSVQSPFAQFRCCRCWGIVYRFLGGHYSSILAPTDSCANPSGSPLLQLFASFERVFAGRYQPLLPAGSSRRYLPESFPGCLTPYPGGPTACICLFLPLCHRPSPPMAWVGFPRVIRLKRLRAGVIFRDGRYFFTFRPPVLRAPQVVPTAAHTAAGQPELLRPGISCFVTSARTGYVNRPNTGN